MSDRGKRGGVTMAGALEQAALDNGRLDAEGKLSEMSRQELARRAGMSNARVGKLRNPQETTYPLLEEAVRLAAVSYRSLGEMVDRSPLSSLERNGMAWRLEGSPRGTRPRACQIAVGRALEGQDQDRIRAAVEVVYAAREKRPLAIDEAALRDLVQAGLEMGLARLESPFEGVSVEDPELATELARSLEQDATARSVDGQKARIRVRVVKNVTHPSFSLDPVAPFLVARVAHEIVGRHLLEHPTVYHFGLAGGMHCSTFVRSTGAESSPFPDDSGDKRVVFVPLTLEPFWTHHLPMADAVVGQMVSQARALLGARRVDGLTLQSFGYIVDERVERLQDDVISQVRQRYRELDVAIFGCGDMENDGWLECVLRGVKIDGPARPATDVCLNLLREDGTPIPLPKGREFVGIGLADIRRLVRSGDRLAVLLTSGRSKGRPIVVASRAGCADTIVCDQAAATAALEVLAEG